jgi:uncharacterized membrane protein YgcG
MSMMAGTAVLTTLIAVLTPVQTKPVLAAPLCGNESPPDYGFDYPLQQYHWTVGWEGFASDEAVSRVDATLDRLNEDSIAQTMILILPADQVGNRVNCAVHFLRYMKLGEPSGERKDNGFVFLIVVEKATIDVHYGVGLGLPALTAQELTNINRETEETYQLESNMDAALLTLTHEFNTVARDNYAPLAPPAESQKPGALEPVSMAALCLQLLVIIMFVAVFLWLSRRGMLGRRGGYGAEDASIPFGRSGSSPWSRGGSFGGGFSRGGGMSSGPTTRSGSGSGRSGRGN